MTSSVPTVPAVRTLAGAIVSVAFLGAVIGGVGAPLITSVAIDLDVPLNAAQWTLTVTLFASAISAPVLGRLGTGAHRRATILLTLSSVAVGGLLTVVPLPFGVLLVGRALQGLGLGAVALLMSVARDHLPAERAQKTIATIAVASTAGIGVAYPLMGLLDELAGLRAAYGIGFLLSLIAVVIAWRVLPADAPRPTPGIDILGAVLLGIAMLGILLVVAQPSVWDTPWVGSALLALAAITLGVWVWLELHTHAPLVDLRLMLAGGVLRANAAILLAGAGMYLLFSLLTRYLQTPADAGYGFGLSGLLAGAALIPFSALGFVAGRLTGWLANRVSARWTFVIYATCVIIAAAIFAIVPGSLVAVLVSMAVLGFAVGGSSAIMPRLVLDGVPQKETASVLSINQIVRTIGFSIGSALAGLLLTTATPPGDPLPIGHGYVTAAVVVLPSAVLSAVIVLAGGRGAR